MRKTEKTKRTKQAKTKAGAVGLAICSAVILAIALGGHSNIQDVFSAGSVDTVLNANKSVANITNKSVTTAVASKEIARPNVLSTCKDNDDGLNFEVQSTTNQYGGGVDPINHSPVLDQSRQDYCAPDSVSGGSHVLIEYSCSNGEIQTGYHYCPYGCVSGSCRTAPGKGTVYVVHAVDTEEKGLDPAKLQNTLDLSNYAAGDVVDQVFADSWRSANRDSFGGKIKYSWFIMDAEAYCESTQADCNLIHTAMAKYKTQADYYGDDYNWHFHLQDWSDLNNDGVSYWNQLLTFNNTQYTHGTDKQIAEKMLASQILDKQTFPAIFRSGWVWENNDYSNWLEDILPFDFSNLAPLYNAKQTNDGIGNVYDWRLASASWSPYHPDSNSYQQVGNQQRSMFRCGGGLTDIFKAFQQAELGQDSIICTYIHSNYTYFYRHSIISQLKTVNAYYPEVKFKFVNALEGIRTMLDIQDAAPIQAAVKQEGDKYTLTTNKRLYAYPFGAVKDAAGKYYRIKPVSLTPTENNGQYSWVFDLEQIIYKEFAIGGVDPAGNTFTTKNFFKN